MLVPVYRSTLCYIQAVDVHNTYQWQVYSQAVGFFCRRHPEEMQRMIPWLSRELFAILRAPGISSLVLERVLDLLPNHEIHSRQFWSGVETYLRHHCDHFIHEFYNFARSPYDMIGFDENAVYSGRTNTPVCVFVMSFVCA